MERVKVHEKSSIFAGDQSHGDMWLVVESESEAVLELVLEQNELVEHKAHDTVHNLGRWALKLVLQRARALAVQSVFEEVSRRVALGFAAGANSHVWVLVTVSAGRHPVVL